VSGRCLGLEGSASLLDALKDCPLEVLDLTGNEICGIKATGTDPFNPFVLKMVCALIIKEGCALRRLRLKGNHMIGNDVYTSEAVFLFSEALRSPRCRLEELQLGLVNKSSGLREEDGMVLGTAVQACASLIKLSVTRAELPMTELLHGSISLDLEGKGLGRTEMGIAAQILRSNGTLRTLKLKQGMTVEDPPRSPERPEIQERPDGPWRQVARVTDNRRRLLIVPVAELAVALRLVVERAWGDGPARIFSFEVGEPEFAAQHEVLPWPVPAVSGRGRA
jgi:hypothetical protein